MSRSRGVGDVASTRRTARGRRMRAADGVPRAAGDHVRQLEHAGAGEAGDAEDLAAVDVEVDAAQPAAVRRRAPRARPARRGAPRPARGSPGRRPRRPSGSRARAASMSATGMRRDHAAAAQHGHAVGQLEDLVEAVRDVEHARARARGPRGPSRTGARPRRAAGPPSARRARARRCRPASPAAPRRSPPPCARPASRRPAGGGCRGRRRSARARGGSPAPARASARGPSRRGRSRRAARGCPCALSSSTRPRSWWTKRSPSGTACPRSKGAPSSSATAAGVGRVVAGERLDQRRLAGAVLAHERVDLAGRMSSDASISARVAPKVFDSPPMCSTGGVGAAPLRLRGA